MESLNFADHLHITQGFCYPDWDAIETFIEKSLPESEWSTAWESVSRTWVGHIGSQLGGDYRVYETPNFLVLSAAPMHIVRHACKSYEEALKYLSAALKGVACFDGFGKQVVLMFASLDDYYDYIAYFYPDGEHPMSGGVCLSSSGYVHYAFPVIDYLSYRTNLVHELTHGTLLHLPLPVWLNEALAMRMENSICGTDVFHFDQEIHEKHQAHWNHETIQQFWTGQSWNIPGDSFELSYNLAYILWRKIEVNLKVPQEAILTFISKANWDDAGQSACRASFSASLGDLLSEFLGKGEWEPQPVTWSTSARDTDSDCIS